MGYKKSILLILLFMAFLPLNAQKIELTFETIFKEKGLYGKSISGVQWFAGDTKYSFMKFDSLSKSTAIFQHDVKTGGESILISKNDLKQEDESESGFMIQNYKWSPDEKNILFTGLLPSRDIKPGGTFYLYNLETKKLSVIAESEEEQANAGFSPDGQKLGFVRNNNLFWADIKTGKITQLTFDGSDVILNGIFDWVYEEEFSIIKGWEWSPDSRKIAFWRLDQSEVPVINIQKWDSLYLNFLTMHYPKPGAKNSVVKIGVVNIYDSRTTWMDLGENANIYIPRIKFTHDPNTLSIMRLNRLQNKLELMLADASTGKSKTIITETSSAWLEIYDDYKFLDNGKQVIWYSEKDGYKHLYLYDLSGKEIRQLTKGAWEVGSLLYAENDKLFFTSNERGIRFNDLYTVSTDGSGFKRITVQPGTHSITISDKGKYFIDKYSNSKTLSSVFLYSIEGKKLADIAVSLTKIDDYGFTFPEFFTFKASDGTDLNAMMIKPWNFDENKRYPVLFDIYGGPGSEPVKDQWGSFSFIWQQFLAKNGYIIFSVDNRGTFGRGTAFRHLVYKNLGTWEVNDMVESAKYLAGLPYVDPSRIGIWGWSYGGYMAALTITKAADYFKTAVAVAPVTDWKFYDDIYTERYMQTPELNPGGYEDGSVLTYTKNYKGNLLVIHGTADDNVHFQNTVALVSKLISEGKQFRTMFYPEKDHGIYGGLTTRQLYRMITDFIFEKL